MFVRRTQHKSTTPTGTRTPNSVLESYFVFALSLFHTLSLAFPCSLLFSVACSTRLVFCRVPFLLPFLSVFCRLMMHSALGLVETTSVPFRQTLPRQWSRKWGFRLRQRWWRRFHSVSACLPGRALNSFSEILAWLIRWAVCLPLPLPLWR